MALNNEWPEEDVALLRKLWAAGLSQAEIGKKLGRGKNSVAGKADRLGLPRRYAGAPHKASGTYEPKGSACVYRPGDPSPYSRRFIEKREASG